MNGPADRGKGGWDEVLAAEGHLVAPWAQDVQREVWSGDDIVSRLRDQMGAATAKVIEASERLGVDWRTAAHAVFVECVAEASRLRAIYP